MFRRVADWIIALFRDREAIEDGVEAPVPNIPSKPPPSSATVSDIQNIELNPEAPKLTHVNKDRARRPKNVRPTTRQSEMPRTRSDNSIKLDESVEEFFSKPSTPSISSIPEKKEETPVKSPSTKSTPESKKKMGGIFNFGHKDKEHKDTKGKEPKKGGLLSKLHGSPKLSPSPKKSRISEVQEEPEDLSTNKSNNALTRSTTENSSLRGSMDKKSETPKDEQTAKVPRSATENVSLSGSLDRKSDKSDSISRKSEDSDSVSRKSEKSDSLDRKSEKSRDKSPISATKNKPAEIIDSHKAISEKNESGSENETEEKTGKAGEPGKMENGDAKKEEKRPLKIPSTKRSFGKADAKKENETVEDKPKEKVETKENVKEAGKDEEENKKAEDKADKEEEKEVKEEVKDSEAEKDKEEENKPLSVAKKPGVPGGIGFGLNIMADLKAKQEKRRSQMPSKPVVPPPDQAENRGSATEEKKSPFGLHKLKPVTKPVPKENNNIPVKPSDNKSSVSVKTGEIAKGDQKATKTDSVKDSGPEKPSVTPRPSGLNKPPPPTRPKPPPTSSKPTPAPRKSLSSTESTEHVARYRHSYAGDHDLKKIEENSNMTDSGIVDDSPRTSVKDALSKFDNNDFVLKKHGSLPRHMKPEDVLKESEDSPKRPKSMFAMVGSRPEFKKQTEIKPDIAEEKEKESPTEEVILV